jgi:MerR family transcriptional regulator, copper efflux regulator
MRRQSSTLKLSDARQEGLYEIGAAAEASGVSVKMIRHYEQIGLIPEATRTVANYRVYSDADVHRLGFIRTARDLGFPMARIKVLLALWGDRNRASADVKTLVMEHVEEIDKRIQELDRMRTTLLDLAAHCHGDDRPECPILGGLSRRKVPG